MSAETRRGVVTATRFTARCKDCGREGRPDEFVYPESWIVDVLERGGSRSDRCPECRQKHLRDLRAMSIPYIDLDVIGVVADREQPGGRLGGLGPLPIEHVATTEERDLAPYDFGLDDDHVRELLRQLDTKQVAVVVAETGSGKSTFLPYRLMEPPPDTTLRLAAHGPIIVTEPRRAAAIDTARFVAEVLHGAPKVGAGCDIGYRVKDKPAFDSACRLIYVTDGSLTNWIREGQLDKFGAIVIDEAHERNKNIDVILAMLRAERQRYPRLKIIVASATMDADFFVEYFGGPEHVARLDAPPEKRFGYGAPIWPIEEPELDHPDWANGELHGVPLREYARRLSELRVVEEPVAEGRYFQGWMSRMPALVVEQCVALHRGTPAGDILAFLPTSATIADAVARLEDELGDEVDVYPFLRGSPEAVQRRARATRPADAPRRIVIATNIAETSLTIDGITFIVDSGLICQSRWDADTASKLMPSIGHSQDGIRQRWGRVGRKEPGFVLPLYTREQYEALEPHTPPEAVRDDLESFELTASMFGVDDFDDFVFPAEFARADESGDPYSETFVKERRRARRALRTRGALDEAGDVTGFGHELLSYQGPISEAGALIGADELCCAVETAVALSMLLNARPIGSFLRFKPKWPARTRATVRRVHEATYAGCRDDLDVALKVFAGWERADDPVAWTTRNYVSPQRLASAAYGRDLRLEFLAVGRSAPVAQPVRIELADRVRAVLARALVDFTYVRDGAFWRALSEDELVYRVDSLAREPSSDRIVALRRVSAREPKMAYLSAIVEAPEWAAEVQDWTSLAAAVARRFREGDGTLRAPSLADHLALTEDWPVGLRVEATAGEGVLEPIRVLDAFSPIRLPDDELDIDAEEEALEDVEADESAADNAAGDKDARSDEPSSEPSGVANPNSATVEEGIPESGEGDLVEADADAVDDVLDETADEQFLDLVVEEENDEIVGASGGEESIPVVPAVARARRVDNEPLVNGIYRVLGYAGIGQERTLLVGLEPVQGLGVLVDEGVGVGDAVVTQCVEVVSDWGPTYVSLREPRSGADVYLGSEELTFSSSDREVARLIPAHAEVEIVVTELDPARGHLDGTRLPLVQRHFRLARPIQLEKRGAVRQLRPAHVLAERWGPNPVVQLDHADSASGLVHRYLVLERSFQRQHLEPVEGLPLLVELKPKAALKGDGWTSKRFRGAPDRLVEVCETSDHLRFDPDQGLLQAAEGMSAGTRDRLLGLSTSDTWRRMIMNLWRETNALLVTDIFPSGETQAFAVAGVAESFPVGTAHIATVTNLYKGNAFVALDSEHSGFLHRSRIGPDGVRDAADYLAVGDSIEVVIDEVGRGKDGKVNITCSARALKTLDPEEQLRQSFRIGGTYTGTVVNLKEFGAFVRLEDASTDCLVHRTKIGPGVIDPRRVLSVGETLEVSVLAYATTPRGPNLELAAPGFSVPPLIDQARELFTASPRIQGEVGRTLPNGRLVRILHLLNALVRFRYLDAGQRAWLEGLPDGAGITVEVVEVREGAGPLGLQIDARLG